jgi:hypothetical protein
MSAASSVDPIEGSTAYSWMGEGVNYHTTMAGIEQSPGINQWADLAEAESGPP